MFNFQLKNQVSKMFLLSIIPGGISNEEQLSKSNYPEEFYYFENAENMIEAIHDNLKETFENYHLRRNNVLEELTAENLLLEHEHGCGLEVILDKNEKAADEDNWLAASIFESLPKVVTLTITVIDVY